MPQQCNDPKVPDDGHTCPDWKCIFGHLQKFPIPKMTFTLTDHGDHLEPDFTEEAWVFRGLEDSRYCLEPSIEREARSSDWSVLEKQAAIEFKSRAHLHFDPGLIPNDELTWLAQMQHYGIPTRLLDFTYSPFVALYFAVRKARDEKVKEDRTVRVWAINKQAINSQFGSVIYSVPANWGPADSLDHSRESLSECKMREALVLRGWIERSLKAKGEERRKLEQGSVCVAQPPTYNPRLASQQGVFLINFAEELTLCESLNKMMECRNDWCERFDISIDAIPEIEKRLFQMNIHEQSLFPDIQGLGSFIRQKLRLHWQ